MLRVYWKTLRRKLCSYLPRNLFTFCPAMRRMSNACWHTQMSKVSTLPHTLTHTQLVHTHDRDKQRQQSNAQRRPMICATPPFGCCDMPQSHPKCLLCRIEFIGIFVVPPSRGEQRRVEATQSKHTQQHPVHLSVRLPFPVIVLVPGRKIFPLSFSLEDEQFCKCPIVRRLTSVSRGANHSHSRCS